MTGAVKAIEKLKKGLSDDPDVSNALRLANEGIDKWIPEGGDKEAYTKFFNKALKKFGFNSPDELEGEKKKETPRDQHIIWVEGSIKETETVHKLGSSGAILAKITQHYIGNGTGMLFFYPTNHHTHMLRFYHHGDALRTQNFAQGLCNLIG